MGFQIHCHTQSKIISIYISIMYLCVCYCPIQRIILKMNSLTFPPQPFYWPDVSPLGDLDFDNTSEQS